jgi:twitching motility protein PilT
VLQKDKSVDVAFDAQAGRFRVNVHYQRDTLATPAPAAASADARVIESAAEPRQGHVAAAGAGVGNRTHRLRQELHAGGDGGPDQFEARMPYPYDRGAGVCSREPVGDHRTDRSGPRYAELPAFLRSILRQSPDVILASEMRDPETIATVLTAAEMGHLVLSTLHERHVAGDLAHPRFVSGGEPAADPPAVLARPGDDLRATAGAVGRWAEPCPCSRS